MAIYIPGAKELMFYRIGEQGQRITRTLSGMAEDIDKCTYPTFEHAVLLCDAAGVVGTLAGNTSGGTYMSYLDLSSERMVTPGFPVYKGRGDEIVVPDTDGLEWYKSYMGMNLTSYPGDPGLPGVSSMRVGNVDNPLFDVTRNWAQYGNNETTRGSKWLIRILDSCYALAALKVALTAVPTGAGPLVNGETAYEDHLRNQLARQASAIHAAMKRCFVPAALPATGATKLAGVAWERSRKRTSSYKISAEFDSDDEWGDYLAEDPYSGSGTKTENIVHGYGLEGNFTSLHPGVVRTAAQFIYGIDPSGLLPFPPAALTAWDTLLSKIFEGSNGLAFPGVVPLKEVAAFAYRCLKRDAPMYVAFECADVNIAPDSDEAAALGVASSGVWNISASYEEFGYIDPGGEYPPVETSSASVSKNNSPFSLGGHAEGTTYSMKWSRYPTNEGPGLGGAGGIGCIIPGTDPDLAYVNRTAGVSGFRSLSKGSIVSPPVLVKARARGLLDMTTLSGGVGNVSAVVIIRASASCNVSSVDETSSTDYDVSGADIGETGECSEGREYMKCTKESSSSSRNEHDLNQSAFGYVCISAQLLDAKPLPGDDADTVYFKLSQDQESILQSVAQGLVGRSIPNTGVRISEDDDGNHTASGIAPPRQQTENGQTKERRVSVTATVGGSCSCPQLYSSANPYVYNKNCSASVEAETGVISWDCSETESPGSYHSVDCGYLEDLLGKPIILISVKPEFLNCI